MRQTIQFAAMIAGLLAAALSLLAALLLAVLVVIDGAAPLASVTVLVSTAALGVGLGVPLAVSGWRSHQRLASPALRLPPVWWLGLIFLSVLLIGQLLLGTRASIVLLPPLHVVASLLPPLMVAAAVLAPLQRAGALFTRRNLVTQLAYGSLAATALAIALEVAVITGVVAAAGAGVALLPGGADSLQRLAADLQAAAATGDPSRLLGPLLSPGFVLGVGLLAAAVIPLLEETVKSLGALFNRSVQGRLSRAQAFTFGVMAGVGFSFTEGLFYAAQQLPHGWAGRVVLRGLTAVIHGAAAGLFALGWYEALAGRPARFFLYAVGGVGLHGAWNALSGLTALAGLGALGGSMTAQAAGGLTALCAVGLLGLTWLAGVAVLFTQTQRLSAGLRQASRGDPDVLA